MRILLVTSNPDIDTLVRTTLAPEVGGADVDTIRGARAGVAWVHSEPKRFDIVIADADTTPMGGMALSREIKARQHMGTPMPPVVLLIARDQDKWLAEWSEADAWCLKPVDPFDLADAVRALVRGEPVPAVPGIVQGGGPMREDAKAIEREGAGGPGGGLTGGAP